MMAENILAWTESEDGTLRAWSDDRSYQIGRAAGRWRLMLDDRTYSSAVWESETLDGCRRMAEFIAADRKRSLDWEALAVQPVEHATDIEGVTIRAVKHPGQWACVLLLEHSNVVGELEITFSPWQANWIVGEPTINCSSFIHVDHLKHRGLGRLMHDLAEEALSLPLIPHGINCAPGSLTPDSTLFWEKRVKHQRVPGLNDQAAANRKTEYDHVTGYMRMERGERLGVEFAIAAADLTGWPVEASFRLDEDGRSLSNAWCVAPDGRAFSAAGFERHDVVLAEATRREGLFGGELPPAEVVGMSVEALRRCLSDRRRGMTLSRSSANETDTDHIDRVTPFAREVMQRHGAPVRAIEAISRRLRDRRLEAEDKPVGAPAL